MFNPLAAKNGPGAKATPSTGFSFYRRACGPLVQASLHLHQQLCAAVIPWQPFNNRTLQHNSLLLGSQAGQQRCCHLCQRGVGLGQMQQPGLPSPLQQPSPAWLAPGHHGNRPSCPLLPTSHQEGSLRLLHSLHQASLQ